MAVGVRKIPMLGNLRNKTQNEKAKQKSRVSNSNHLSKGSSNEVFQYSLQFLLLKRCPQHLRPLRIFLRRNHLMVVKPVKKPLATVHKIGTERKGQESHTLSTGS